MIKSKFTTGPEATDRLAEAVDNLTQRLQVVDDTMSDILHELRWLLQNHVSVRVINRLPAEPADREWSAKLAKLNPQAGADGMPESIACSDCDADSPESLAEALQVGWVSLQRVGGQSRNYLGLCPSCQEEQMQIDAEPAESKEPEPSKQKRATTLF